MVNNWAPAKSQIPGNMAIEAPVHRKTARLFHAVVLWAVTATQTNNMHAGTERDSLGCPVVYW